VGNESSNLRAGSTRDPDRFRGIPCVRSQAAPASRGLRHRAGLQPRHPPSRRDAGL